jgi:penicillin-binding protein 1A
MVKAVARRPTEEFETEVTLPNWQVEGDNQAWAGEPDDFMLVDPDGNPIAPDGQPRPEATAEPRPAPRDEPAPEEELNQDWLDRVTGRNRPPPPQREPPPPPDDER